MQKTPISRRKIRISLPHRIFLRRFLATVIRNAGRRKLRRATRPRIDHALVMGINIFAIVAFMPAALALKLLQIFSTDYRGFCKFRAAKGRLLLR